MKETSKLYSNRKN